MAKYFKRILSCILVIGIVCFLICKLSEITIGKASTEKYAGFFDQDEDFDVLFLGTSHVINDIYPLEIYARSGIVSYNFGRHANELATSYWILKNALDYTNPWMPFPYHLLKSKLLMIF